jgi:hypothetical protein
LRCRDARGFISDNFAIQTAGLASPASDSTADAKRRHSFDVAVLLSPSARERLRQLENASRTQALQRTGRQEGLFGSLG